MRPIWQGHDIDSGRLNVAGRTLCSVAIPHNTKLEAPLRKRSLLRLRSDYLNYSQWKRCKACSTVDMIVSFSLPMCSDESGHTSVPVN